MFGSETSRKVIAGAICALALFGAYQGVNAAIDVYRVYQFGSVLRNEYLVRQAQAAAARAQRATQPASTATVTPASKPPDTAPDAPK